MSTKEKILKPKKEPKVKNEKAEKPIKEPNPKKEPKAKKEKLVKIVKKKGETRIKGYFLTLTTPVATRFKGDEKEMNLMKTIKDFILSKHPCLYSIIQKENNTEFGYHYHLVGEFESRQNNLIFYNLLKPYVFEVLKDYLPQDQLNWISGKGCYLIKPFRCPYPGVVGYVYKDRHIHEPYQEGLKEEAITAGIAKYAKLCEDENFGELTEVQKLNELKEYMISNNYRFHHRSFLIDNSEDKTDIFEAKLELDRPYLFKQYMFEKNNNCKRLPKYKVDKRYIEYNNYYLDYRKKIYYPKLSTFFESDIDELLIEVPICKTKINLRLNLIENKELKFLIKMLKYNNIDIDFFFNELNKAFLGDNGELYAVWIYGNSGNGKSTLLRFIEVIFGSNMKALSNDGIFTLANVARFTIVTCPEFDPYENKHAKMIKHLTNNGQEKNCASFKHTISIDSVKKDVVIGSTNQMLHEEAIKHDKYILGLIEKIEIAESKNLTHKGHDEELKTERELEGVFRRIHGIHAQGKKIPLEDKDTTLEDKMVKNAHLIFQRILQQTGMYILGDEKDRLSKEEEESESEDEFDEYGKRIDGKEVIYEEITDDESDIDDESDSIKKADNLSIPENPKGSFNDFMNISPVNPAFQSIIKKIEN